MAPYVIQMMEAITEATEAVQGVSDSKKVTASCINKAERSLYSIQTLNVEVRRIHDGG